MMVAKVFIVMFFGFLICRIDIVGGRKLLGEEKPSLEAGMCFQLPMVHQQICMQSPVTTSFVVATTIAVPPEAAPPVMPPVANAPQQVWGVKGGALDTVNGVWRWTW